MTLIVTCRAAPRRIEGRWLGRASATAFARPVPRPASIAVIIGPQGRNGLDGSIPLRTALAAVALSGHRAVFVGSDGKFHLCQPNLTARLCVGITTGAAAQNAEAIAQTGGLMDEPSWAWDVTLPVWLGPDGALSQTLPTTGALLQVGTPAGPTTLRIEPQFIALLP